MNRSAPPPGGDLAAPPCRSESRRIAAISHFRALGRCPISNGVRHCTYGAGIRVYGVHPDGSLPDRVVVAFEVRVMKSSAVIARLALVSFCFAFNGAQALSGDLIFDADFDADTNGGTSCDTALVLAGDTTFSSDTTAAPNWVSSYGPLLSPSNDVVYVFVAGPDVAGSITPTIGNYDFAMYLIPSCTASGSQVQPIGATATLGRGIDLVASGVISGNTYYLAITGSASGGPGANGHLNFTTPPSLGIVPR